VINKVGPGLPEVVHRPDEYVPLENLVRGTEFFIRLALRWLGQWLAPV
jgi:acetylornithine deacetylase/succinyl-diaminopimelate desuccinylase-like protein